MGQNVTMLMSVGWDFIYEDGIRDRNTGIWRSVRVYSTGQAQLRSPMVRSALNAPAYDRPARRYRWRFTTPTYRVLRVLFTL